MGRRKNHGGSRQEKNFPTFVLKRYKINLAVRHKLHPGGRKGTGLKILR